MHFSLFQLIIAASQTQNQNLFPINRDRQLPIALKRGAVLALKFLISYQRSKLPGLRVVCFVRSKGIFQIFGFPNALLSAFNQTKLEIFSMLLIVFDL
jgi:hypothetical protein